MTKMTETNKEYSKALFMLAVEENKQAEYLSQLEEIKSLIEENPEYIDFLASPALPLSERLSSIQEAFSDKFFENIVSFICLLVENRHIKELLPCIDEFCELVRASLNRTTATVTSALPLSEAEKTALLSKLESVYGKKIDAVYLVDSKLLGGIKVSLEGRILDGSMEKQLKKVGQIIR